MNIKKAILASMLVSSMLVAVADPIPAGAGAAQEQQLDRWTIQIDPKWTEKLNQAVKLFAGEDVQLQKVGKLDFNNKNASKITEVRSVDGKYSLQFDYDTGIIWTVSGKTATIDQISKQEQEDVLKWLKAIYPKKKYAFDNEVEVIHQFTDEKLSKTSKAEVREEKTYELKGKDFSASLHKLDGIPEHIGHITIDFDKKELDPKLLKTVVDAAQTVSTNKFEMTTAQLRVDLSPIISKNKPNITWVFHDGKVTIYADPNTGKINSIYNELGKQVRENKGISEKEAREAVAPIVKKVFNIDMNGYSVKWDGTEKDFAFTKKNGMNVRAALDANKKVVYIRVGRAAAPGIIKYAADLEAKPH
ncbi:hypothetical protein BBG47_27970 [Paenibacillus sp. KS1]|uniref:hypothetical protein n=1 Tax=Paenibacillus sp. KS1 TaxID=1849249 RepID=UPI0008065C95|nr:hypothetical protein [Paenibacillus sp. KS1]OBY76303.1 hypothetical protein BBG47_27970 [Paenibacillus sp. KS1]